MEKSEIESKIEKLQKLVDDKRSTAEEKAKYKKAIEALKDKLPKKEEKKEAEKKVPAKVEEKKTPAKNAPR